VVGWRAWNGLARRVEEDNGHVRHDGGKALAGGGSNATDSLVELQEILVRHTLQDFTRRNPAFQLSVELSADAVKALPHTFLVLLGPEGKPRPGIQAAPIDAYELGAVVNAAAIE